MKKAMDTTVKRDFNVSAPGKVILHGEHAVVYGKTALASSLNLRTFLQLRPTVQASTASFKLLDIGLEWEWNTEELAQTFSECLGQREAGDAGPPTPVLLAKMKKFTGVSEDGSTRDLAVLAVLYLYLSVLGSGKASAFPSLEVSVTSELPTGAGLGSSAAFSVCLSAAFLLQAGITSPVDENGLNQRSWNKDDLDVINCWAFEAERIIHGNPSGIDNAVSTYGGALRYQGKAIQPLSKVPNLRILLINTKIPRSTKVLVAGVRKKYEKFPEVIGPVLESIEGISQMCQSLFEEFMIGPEKERGSNPTVVSNQSDSAKQPADQVAPTVGGTEVQADQTTSLYGQLEDLIDMNQKFLEILGVSHPSLEALCSLTAKFGLHSKLTGAGGGGCALTLLRPDTAADTVMHVREEVAAVGYDLWETSIGGVGVAFHADLNRAKEMGFNVPETFLGKL
ncbi:mevalonate kinase-like [Acanthaster planci]|uniref:Mevalonate kinase n=1 Tax=Acanthaster planci TaxID=133434 RepID=A0A8B7ZGF5_ACAPL|nr:mevalonate kinase-like [Acanthaster planci]